MKHSYIFIFMLLTSFCVAQELKPTIYLLPGQGADHRLFSKLELADYPFKHIEYVVPVKGSSMNDYARQLSTQIDQSKPFILIGTSLGGMLSCEMNEFMNPEKVIIISSAQNQQQLPGRYNFQKKIPIYKLIGGGVSKLGARILQPIVEPDRKVEKEIFVSMLKAKDKKFMKRSIKMIIEWDKETFDESIIHIHGDNDHTIPFKNVNCKHIVPNGSHMMTLTRPEEINQILKLELDL